VLLASLLLLSSLAAQGQDTTFAATRGERLRLGVHEGSITVSTWDRNAVRVQAEPEDDDDDARLDISRSAGVISVSVRGRNGPPPEATFTLTVPAWMPLSLNSVEGDITVRGSAAAITAETVNGSVSVTGGVGNVSLSSVDGSVELSRASGNISVSTVNDDVTVRNSTGTVAASTVNGEVTLDAVTSSAVSVESVNGDVRFSGPIRNGGRYQLNTHNGDVTVGVQSGANVTVLVNTFSGDFSTDIPVEIRTRKRQDGSFSFVLGDGSARLELGSFQGSIQLMRPGQFRDQP
jgi:DUF4097 and DUF4098 domain-containing protein YvlB